MEQNITVKCGSSAIMIKYDKCELACGQVLLITPEGGVNYNLCLLIQRESLVEKSWVGFKKDSHFVCVQCPFVVLESFCSCRWVTTQSSICCGDNWCILLSNNMHQQCNLGIGAL